ncbi:conserved hypothetical protein [Methanosphaerula palustris E1-9c]|uniref:DUF3566 domain-containing protein n=2 Tax=Methanosphaerula palustris TaxID=475088 RepID=B8GEQ3_METPE|nr:conserved hypothetical protein [Methanosphaerula palustris E1-9c]
MLSMATTAYMIRHFGVISVGKFSAVFGLIWGFLMGIPLAAGLGGMGSVMNAQALGIGTGIVGLVLMIIIGGVGGFIGGAIMAIVYNLVLGATGGIEMDIEVKP